jgi:uncharacterized protein YegL
MEYSTSTDIVPAGFELPRGEPGPFAPCVLLVDCSASMGFSGAINEVNEGLRQFQNEVKEDELARNRADIAVVAFQEPGLRVEVPPVLARDFVAPTLAADGATPIGAAIHLGLDTIEARRSEYRSRGAQAYAAMMFLLTDGEPTDDFTQAVTEAHAMEAKGKLNFFCIGTEEANFTVLERISSPGRPPAKLVPGKFRELFKWISDSLNVTSNSRPGDTTSLPPTSGWSTIKS